MWDYQPLSIEILTTSNESRVYKLIQIPHTIQDFEFAGSGENSGKVVSFRIGL